MPIYTPKAYETEFRGGKNILASEHFQFIEAGATLDGTEFDGYFETGQMIGRDSTTGKWVPFDHENADIDQVGITNIDFEGDGEHDMVIGEVIVRGSVYEEKLAGEVHDDFKAANPLIRYVTHI